MSVTNVTREELWAKQHLSCKNMDYAVWERDKSMLQKLSRINGGQRIFLVGKLSFKRIA